MKLSNKLSIAAAGVVMGLASVSIPSSAQAAQLFKLDYNLGGSSVDATLTTTDLDPVTNSYTITDITGTRTFQDVTQTIFGLLPTGTDVDGTLTDNKLFANAPFLDSNGFGFFVNSGLLRVSVSPFGVGGAFGDYGEWNDRRTGVGGSNFNVTNITNARPVPEPTTVAAAIASGAGLIAAKLKQRKKQKASQAA
ncbi:PEP-CTERM sorting domain-containing protein [Calothrix sp. NIES-2098]|uniref:PEP-CTERM sorting domain-containing protein n=1 Tax=Calothrix sp. NIES-2098 TaxID=1954171 RepID=UPI000B615BF5|nr:hypothetical protein NIES2098_74340 [Calothrix sp. NIES-2098]